MICHKQFRNLLIHLQKSKACQTHYDMDSLQRQAREKLKSRHTEAQASYRRRQLLEDPIAYRHKHAIEQAATKQKNIEKDPLGTRAKHARAQAASKQRKMEKDPIGTRDKHAKVQAAQATRRKILATCQETPFQVAPSWTSAVIYQSENIGSLVNEVTAQQSTHPESESLHRAPVAFENSMEYIVGGDDTDMESPSDSSWEKVDDSTISDSDSTSSDVDDEDEARSTPVSVTNDPEYDPRSDPESDPESDSGSDSSATDVSSDSSSDTSSDCFNNLHSKIPAPNVESTVCSACGRGPFRSLKLHLLHCSGIKVKYECSLCKKLFPTRTSLCHHYMSLYSCDVCGQVFFQEKSYSHHECPKAGTSPFIFFCPESMPKVCNICRAFFTSEKTLLNHVTRVHTSVISTKLSIITNPSVRTYRKILPAVSGSAALSASSSFGHILVASSATCQNPNTVTETINGNLSDVTSSPSSYHTNTDRPPTPICMIFSSSSSAPNATDTTPAVPVAQPASPPAPTIMAMFENHSHEVALMKRMSTHWRSKGPYPCRQCGAILRQPSFIISHRYRHRGRRSHRCWCGRAFKNQLHVLRHCVQHAEAISYICVSCGESFTGAKLFAEHMRGKSQKKCSFIGQRERKMSFTCDCGQQFIRASAYIWHQLKNNTKNKWKKLLK
ncbi:hypothetical protein PAMA_014318 [Pampus argenteus]